MTSPPMLGCCKMQITFRTYPSACQGLRHAFVMKASFHPEGAVRTSTILAQFCVGATHGAPINQTHAPIQAPRLTLKIYIDWTGRGRFSPSSCSSSFVFADRENRLKTGSRSWSAGHRERYSLVLPLQGRSPATGRINWFDCAYHDQSY